MSYFNNQSDAYKAFRPSYQPALFDWLRTIAGDGAAWDAGCGSGQASAGLARTFEQVIATDLSQSQLDLAPALSNVSYRCESASHSSIPAATIGLTLVAQALHWFDLDPFYREVRRVSASSAAIVAVTYDLLAIEGMNDLIHHLYYDVLGKYWPSERHHVETGYSELAFPFQPITSPAFAMEAEWTLDHLFGYLRSWSALVICEQSGDKPLERLRPQFESAWGNPAQSKAVSWPLTILAGRV